MIHSLVLATGNPGKLREIRQVLGDLPIRVVGLDAFASIEQPEETGATFAANARAKARYYARRTRLWALAEDSGLEVDALGGAPGVYSARYAAADCAPGAPREEIDKANNAKLLAELRDVPDGQRTARFVCHVAMADCERVLIETCGTVEGRITRAARGDSGFGYDPVFFVPAAGRTSAEMGAEEKNRISHRGLAVRRFAALLKDFLVREA